MQSHDAPAVPPVPDPAFPPDPLVPPVSVPALPPLGAPPACESLEALSSPNAQHRGERKPLSEPVDERTHDRKSTTSPARFGL
jgi:hypothetical protein